MNNYTYEEKQLIVASVKKIFEYLTTEIKPKLHECISYRYHDNPRCYPMVLQIYPGKNPEIAMFRNAIGSSHYALGQPYDSKNSYNTNTTDLFARYDVMYSFLKEWPKIKEFCQTQIKEESDIINNLQNFVP